MSDSEERNLLGAVLLDPRLWEQASVLTPDDFSVDANGRIHGAIGGVMGRGDPPSVLTIVDELEKRGELAAVRGHAYVSMLTEEAVVSRKHVEHCAARIRRDAGRRHIGLKAAAIAKQAEEFVDFAELRTQLTALLADTAKYELCSQIEAFENLPDVFSLASEPTRWLVDGLIPQGTITVIAGSGGVGKSLLALRLARSVELGSHFLGRPTESKRVLYLDRENPLNLVRDRLQLISGGPGLFNPWGQWHTPEPPLISDPRLLEFATEGWLIIFDSLIRFHDADENFASEMKVVMGNLRALTHAGATVIVLHHRGKADGSKFRGSSEIRDGCDQLFALSRDEGYLKLQSEKVRSIGALTVTLKPNYTDYSFEVVPSGEFEESASGRDAVEIIAEIIANKPGISQNQIIEQLTMRKEAAGELLRKYCGHFWRSELGSRKSNRYFPVTGSEPGNQFPHSGTSAGSGSPLKRGNREPVEYFPADLPGPCPEDASPAMLSSSTLEDSNVLHL